MQRQAVIELVSLLILLVVTPVLRGQDTPSAEQITSDNVSQLEERLLLVGHESTINSIAFSPTQPILASGSDDSTVRLWDLNTGDELAVLEEHTDPVEIVAFSPDGQFLATGGKDDTVRLWDLNTNAEVAVLEGHTGQVRSLAYAQVNRILASGDIDGAIHLWNLANLEEIAVLDNNQSVWTLSFRPNESELVTTNMDLIVVWEISIDEERYSSRTLGEHPGESRAVSFSPDGSILASGGFDDTLRLWEVETGEELVEVTTPFPGDVDAVAFSPDGSLLAFDGASILYVLDVQNAEILTDLRVSSGSIRSIAFGSLGNMIAATSGDVIYIWALPDSA